MISWFSGTPAHRFLMSFRTEVRVPITSGRHDNDTAVEHSAMSCSKMVFSSDTSSRVMSLLGINMHTSLILNPSVWEPVHTVELCRFCLLYTVRYITWVPLCSQAPSSISSVHARGDPKNEATNCFQYYWDSFLWVPLFPGLIQHGFARLALQD